MRINALFQEGIEIGFLYHDGNGIGMGIQSREWEEIGTEKSFPLISIVHICIRVGLIVTVYECVCLGRVCI